MVEERKIGVGVGVMILRGDKVLLGRRHGDPLKASSELNGAGTWTMPGGKLNFGESFEDAAVRETFEETGLSIEDFSVICFNNDLVETAQFVTIGLLCKNVKGEPEVMEPQKITEWAWFDLNDVPYPLYFPSAKILENYRENKFYIKKN